MANAQALLRSGHFRVRAVTRDPSKAAAQSLREAGAEVVAANLEDTASLAKVLAPDHKAKWLCLRSARKTTRVEHNA